MDRQSPLDVRRRIQAGANAWRKADGHTSDRRNYKTKLKRNMLRVCVTSACLHGVDTMALTEQQQQEVKVCESNWVRMTIRT